MIRLLGPLAAALVAAMPATSAAAAPSAARRPALIVGADSFVRSQVVALGRDLEIRGEALQDVAAVQGSVRVTGRVEGDVIVLGGDARIASGAEVGGDVFVVGGVLESEPGARIGGRAVSYPTVSAAWLTLLEGPSLGLSPLAPVVVGAKLALLAAWMSWTLLAFATTGRQVLATSEGVASEPFRNFAVGLTAVLTLVMTAMLLSAVVPALAALPLLALVVLMAVLLKLWGMVAVFHALGLWLARRSRRRVRPLNAAVLGLLVLGVLKLVPWVGTWVWTAATLIAVGSALTTKFGRREPWLEAVDLDRLASLSAS